jgi:hypothetical protein
MPSGSLNVSTAPYPRSAMGRVGHAELLEPRQPPVQVGPCVDFEPHVIESGAPWIEGFTRIPVAGEPVDFGELAQRSPPSGARLGVTDRKRNV